MGRPQPRLLGGRDPAGWLVVRPAWGSQLRPAVAGERLRARASGEQRTAFRAGPGCAAPGCHVPRRIRAHAPRRPPALLAAPSLTRPAAPGPPRRLLRSHVLPPWALLLAPQEIRAPVELVRQTKALGRLPVVNFAAGGVATPADAALMMQASRRRLGASWGCLAAGRVWGWGCAWLVSARRRQHPPLISPRRRPPPGLPPARLTPDPPRPGPLQLGMDGVFVGSGIFKSGDPAKRARAIVQAVTHYNDPAVLAEVRPWGPAGPIKASGLPWQARSSQGTRHVLLARSAAAARDQGCDHAGQSACKCSAVPSATDCFCPAPPRPHPPHPAPPPPSLPPGVVRPGGAHGGHRCAGEGLQVLRPALRVEPRLDGGPGQA